MKESGSRRFELKIVISAVEIWRRSLHLQHLHSYKPQLFNTTSLLDEQKHLYQELKKKLKEIDVEDDRRRERNVEEMDKYYKNKLNDIQTELVRD